MKNLTRVIALTLMVFVTYSCNKNPITGRKGLNLLPESQLVAMSLTSYSQFLSENPPVASTNSDAQMVKNTGARIATAVLQYMKQQGLSKKVKGYKWEFNLVNDDQANAWAMPGGKVVVYSGILKHTQDERGLAFVLGHEIAHAIARHGNERMSQMLLAQTGSLALDVAMANKPAETRAMYQTAFGATTQLGVLLPFSREHESEADKMGLVFMAMAGYDPRGIGEFWSRMEAAHPNETPNFLRTHPTNDKRIKAINDYMPTALKYYKPKN